MEFVPRIVVTVPKHNLTIDDNGNVRIGEDHVFNTFDFRTPLRTIVMGVDNSTIMLPSRNPMPPRKRSRATTETPTSTKSKTAVSSTVKKASNAKKSPATEKSKKTETPKPIAKKESKTKKPAGEKSKKTETSKSKTAPKRQKK